MLSRDEIEQVLDTAQAMAEVLERPVARTPALRGVTVFNLFYEASTRTRGSFELAGKVLGADVINLTGSGSSVEKGESLINTLKTLSAVGADVVVMRHPASGAPYLAARTIDGHIINAGDGQHAHPTQALLDAYILRRELGDLDGRRVVIVGDILHSRVARSNVLVPDHVGRQCDSRCSPLAGTERTCERLGRAGASARTASRGGRIRSRSCDHRGRRGDGSANPTRADARRTAAERLRVCPALPGDLGADVLRRRRNAVLMHPGPMNEGVEIASDVAHGPQSQIEAQVAAGLAVRMAVLFLLVRGAQ